MSRHYNSSAPVEWLRKKLFKVEKPDALGWGEWEKWEIELKKKQPIAYFITEIFPEWLEWFPKHSIDYVHDLRWYIVCRRNSSHCLPSTLKKGQYHEFETRMLYSMFDSFADFVECELAQHNLNCSNEEDIKKYAVPWWRKIKMFRWGKKLRSPELGCDYLKWEMALNDDDPNVPAGIHSSQSTNAREKMALYTWWRHIRTQRPAESYIASGLSEFWTAMDEKYKEEGVDRSGNWLGMGRRSCLTTAERVEYDRLSKASDDIEEEWIAEDTAMMIRLINVRRSLWT